MQGEDAMRRWPDIALGMLLWIGGATVAVAQTARPACPEAPQYGNDASAGHFAKVNGISLYYEIHGQGAPLLLIHGNGDSINSVRCQIASFSRSRRVIVADSRSHGRSDSGEGRLTYEKIADDLAALLDQLTITSSDVWGHSDGGIVALLVAIRHPAKVAKLISSSPNLRPDETALFPWFLEGVRTRSKNAADMIEAGDRSQDWGRIKRQQDLMLEEPHISTDDLRKIPAPTLLMFADADIIPLSHALEIFNGIPLAQLFVMPGATHGVPRAESDTYNAVVA
jgi:pimeloyl-ACP methyl ester carboxylesterase